MAKKKIYKIFEVHAFHGPIMRFACEDICKAEEYCVRHGVTNHAIKIEFTNN